MKLIAFLLGILLIILGLSVLVSGLRYQYDWDELAQLNVLYLIAQGYTPYVSFYTIYTPILHIFLMPVFALFGFTFKAITISRVVMAVLFALRIAAGAIVASYVFNRKVALFFVGLILLDPFTVFAGMQIRTDSVMLTALVVGLAILTLGFYKKKKYLFPIAGFSFAIGVLSNVKIFPSFLALFIILFFWSVKTKKWQTFFSLWGGASLVLVGFFGYFLVTGTIVPLIQQVFVDPGTFLSKIQNPTPFGFFYKPDNIFIYGVPGKPFIWVYALALPVLGSIGALIALIREKHVLTLILVASLFGQFILLLTLKTAFIQYYLPSNWYFALFGAVTIREIWVIGGIRVTKILIFILFAVLVWQSVVANLTRSKLDTSDIEKRYTHLWTIVPENAYVFPDLLFRKIRYPIVSGYFVGQNGGMELIRRYPPVTTYLATVNYVLLTDFAMSYIDTQTKLYISQNFTQVPGEEGVYRRKL